MLHCKKRTSKGSVIYIFIMTDSEMHGNVRVKKSMVKGNCVLDKVNGQAQL